MKILILGSVALPVPPPMQGGTERIAYLQATGLGKRGHAVTLVAATGSHPSPAYTLVEIGGGDTVTGSKQARNAATGSFTEGSRAMRKELTYLTDCIRWLDDNGKNFDVWINNMRGGESVLLPTAARLGVPMINVMHLPLFPELAALFVRYKTPVISISGAQRRGFDDVRFVATAYNCVDPELFAIAPRLTPPANGKGTKPYVVMMGSIAPHKNQKDGILAARETGKTIVIAGKIGNEFYWQREISPLVDGETVIHKGEMKLAEKAALLAGAEALLFPVVWPEPFGLVMIEAMSCGTPVIAFDNGAVSEVVRDGVTGFVIHPARHDGTLHHRIPESGVGGMVAALAQIGSIDRGACRRHVEANFTMDVMIDSLEDGISATMSES